MNMVMLRPNERETSDGNLCFNNPAWIGVCGCGQQASDACSRLCGSPGRQGSIFYGSKSVSRVRASYSVLGESCGKGLVCDQGFPIIQKNAAWC